MLGRQVAPPLVAVELAGRRGIAIRAIVATAQTGSMPIAVSPDSMTALVPSKTALATSVTSARVGTGELIIDSSIWVAVMTGRPQATEERISLFCMWGTSSSATRTPRSPRATISGVGDSQDVVDVLERLGGLHLGADQDAPSRDDAHSLEVRRRAHKRDRHALDALLQEHLEALQVLRCRCRQRKPGCRGCYARDVPVPCRPL